MLRVGILSDTHGYLHPEVPRILGVCDEIWHAGDFGTFDVVESIRAIKPLYGVYGNIDGKEIRREFPLVSQFTREKIEVMITHIGGYPGKYEKNLLQILNSHAPDLLVCGHSHILKVMYDKRFNLLYVNPGAAGKYGHHKVITLVRLVIDGSDIKDLEVIELEP
ncbi:MAG TPA: metallophosphoesterase family protein [Bacteroidales bacterium]|nr:metallophosphoesterase family protein [Bacteroidales bacterium]